MKKRSIRLLKISSSLLMSGIVMGSVVSPFINSSNNVDKLNSLSEKIDIKAIGGGNGQDQILTFTVNTNPSWKGQKFANQVTNDEIKGMLKPNKEFGANYYVKILPITNDMLTQGYVEFVVVQQIPIFEDGVTTGTTKKEFITPPTNYNAYPKSRDSKAPQEGSKVEVDGEQVDQAKVWTTKTSISDLFLKRKYSFKWNTDAEIGAFLKATSKTTLTPEDIKNNFISTVDSTDILPVDTAGTFKQESITYPADEAKAPSQDTISTEDAKQYGVGQIKVTFEKQSEALSKKIQSSDWASGKAPTEKETTRIVRGLNGSDGNKHTVTLNAENNGNALKTATLDLAAIKKTNTNFVYPFDATGDKTTISNFTPSQLLNALGPNGLKDLLTTTNYVPKAANGEGAATAKTLPPLYITYMGKTAFDDTTLPFKGTGLSHDTNVPYVDKNYNPIIKDGVPVTTNNNSVNNVMNIIDVTGNAIDEKGTLELKVRYNYYDVFNNVIVSDYEVPITITGMKVNKDANKNLYFEWKSDADLMYSSAADFLKMYTDNSADKTFIQDLSNSLFYGSSDTYQKERKFELTQATNGDNKQLIATITFDTYGDNYYMEGNNKVKGFKTTKTFTFQNATSNNAVQFNTTENVKSEIKNWEQYTPEQLINDISENKIDKNIFFKNGTYSTNASINNQVDTRADENVLFIPNETNNGIIVRVYKGNEMFASSFTGLAQGQSQDFIYNFSFTPNTEDQNYQKLLNIPVEQITKQNVIDLYLKDLDIFKVYGNQFELTENDVQLTPNPEKGSLEIAVTVNGYDSSNPDANRVFKTTLQGLKSQTLVDNNSYVAPLNLTIPLSAVFAGVITIALGTTLFLIVRKRMKLNKVNKSKKQSQQSK